MLDFVFMNQHPFNLFDQTLSADSVIRFWDSPGRWTEQNVVSDIIAQTLTGLALGSFKDQG